MKIRRITQYDVLNGFKETLSTLKNVDKPDRDLERIFYERYIQGIVTLVAVEETVVGTASILPEIKYYGKVAHVEDVVVRKEYQKQGIGKKLMEAVVAEAKGLGCYKIILGCTDDVRGFYESFGFHRHNNEMRLEVT